MVDRPHTSPQPTRGDVELKVYFRQFVWYVPLWPVDTIEQYRVVASLNALKFNPLTFFSSGPCFTDIWQWSVDSHRHLAINSHTFLSSRNGPGRRVKFWKLLRCNVTRGQKWRRFGKHLASLHRKIQKGSKTGGHFWKLLPTSCCSKIISNF